MSACVGVMANAVGETGNVGGLATGVRVTGCGDGVGAATTCLAIDCFYCCYVHHH